MKYKANQRVCYYRVTGLSDPSPAKNLAIGDVLVDRNRGEQTSWEFLNMESGSEGGWITGTRIGYARVDADTLKPVPEPSLAVILEGMKNAALDREPST